MFQEVNSNTIIEYYWQQIPLSDFNDFKNSCWPGGGQCRENFWISIDLLKDFYGSKISLSGETFHAQKFMRRSGRVGGNIGPETLSISRDQSWKCSNENLNWLRCFCFPLTPDVFQLGEFAMNFEENKSPADIWRSLTVCKPRHQRQHWSRILLGLVLKAMTFVLA